MAQLNRLMSGLFFGLLTACFVITPAAAQSLDDYRSMTPVSGSWKSAASWERYNGSAWVAAITYPTDLNAHAITVRGGSTLSITSALTVDEVTIESGATVSNSSTLTTGSTSFTLHGTLSNTGTFILNGGMQVFGTFRTSGTVTTADNAIWVRTGGTYQHAVAATAGTIPGCSWETGSTLAITGYTTNTEELSLVANPEPQNIIWNCAGQTSTIPFPSDIGIVRGSLTIASTGSGCLVMNTTASGRPFWIDGNFTQSGGTFDLSSGSAESALWVKGNLALYDGTLTETGSATEWSRILLIPDGGATADITVDDGFTFANHVGLYVYATHAARLTQDCDCDDGEFRVSGTLDCGEFVVRGASFILEGPWGDLGIGSEHGIAASAAEGNIQTSSRTFPDQATYRYTYTLGEGLTGDGIPSSVTNLVADAMDAGLNLEKNITVTDGLTVKRPLRLGSYDLTVGADAVLSANAQVDVSGTGTFRRSIGATGSYVFPVGTFYSFTPCTVTITGGSFSNASIAADLTATKHPANSSTTSYLKRYWTLTGSGLTGLVYNASFTYATADIVGPEEDISCGRYGAPTWYLGDQTDAATNRMTIAGQTAFGDFTGGESWALPVQLAAIGTERIADGTRISWRTLSEVNNYGFTVQRRLDDALIFVDLPEAFVPGHGTTLEQHAYAFVDHAPPLGVAWYRLRQVDLDGSEHAMGTLRVDGVTGVPEPPVPQLFALHQNYPNPFNPSTTITYDLPERSQVRLEICDLLGRTVRIPVDAVQGPGAQTVVFDASGLSSGVYLYRLHAGSTGATRRMAFIR